MPRISVLVSVLTLALTWGAKGEETRLISPTAPPLQFRVSDPAHPNAVGNLQFNYQIGGNAPASQGFMVTTNAAATYTATATPASWLRVSPAGGTLIVPVTNFTVSVNVTGLAVGTYNGSITVAVTGGSPISVAVTLVVSSANSGGATNTGSLQFNYQIGGSQPASQNFTITTNLAATYTATATPASWLRVNPTSGTLIVPATTFTASVNATGLSAGTYSGNITVAVSGGSTNSITVTLIVSSGTPATGTSLQAATCRFDRTTLANSCSIDAWTISLSGGAAVPYTATASSAGNWLSVTPVSGTLPVSPASTIVGFTINPLNLANNTYTGTITVLCNSTVCPAVGVVTLIVTSTVLPTISANPPNLTFSYIEGTPWPLAQQIAISGNVTGTSFSVSAPQLNGVTRILFSPNSGTVPANLSVSIDPDGLAKGSYTGSLLITSPTATNSPLSIPITINVSEPTSIPFVSQNGFTPPSPYCFVVHGDPEGGNFTVATSGDSWLAVNLTTGVTPANLCVTAAASSLGPGSYSGTVTIAGADTLTIQVSVAISPPPKLGLDTSSLSFLAIMNGPLPATQTLAVTSDIPTLGVPISAAISTNSGGDWLSLSSIAFSTPANIVVSIKPVTLPPGTYTGTIALTSSNIPNGLLKIPVTLKVPDIRISALLTSLSFAYQIGSEAPAPQTLSITSPTTEGNAIPILFNANAVTSSGANWLVLNSSSGTTPSTLSVSVTPKGLASGTYNATITLSASSASNNSVTVPVTLVVSKPKLVLQQGSLSFNYQVGGTLPFSKSLPISSSGVAMPFTSTLPSVSWLKVDSTSGITGTPLNFTVSPASLAVGTYTTVITISSPEADGTQVVAIALVVRDRSTVIAKPLFLNFTWSPVSGIAPPGAQTVSISGGNTIYNAIVSSGANWLSIDSPGGTTPGSFNVFANPAGMDPGSYTGSILITSPSAGNSPVTISVSLNVVRASQLLVTPTAFTFQSQFGSGVKQSQSVSVNASGERINFLSATTTVDGGNWLAISPDRGTTLSVETLPSGAITNYPIQLNLSVNPNGLPVGVHSGTITLNPDSGSPAVNLTVSLTITGNRLRIPQVADGGSWKTTIVLVNTDVQPSPFTINFYQPDGSTLSLPLNGSAAAPSYSDTIPVGGSRILETPGLGDDLLQGWAEVLAGGAISGVTIFRHQLSSTEAAEGSVPLRSESGKHFLLPFDDTNGFTTALALLNPDASQATSVSMTFLGEGGQKISSESLALPAGNRQAISLAGQYSELVNRRGVVDVTSSTVDLSAFGLRFNPGNDFTSIDPISLDNLSNPGTPGAISQIADGGQWLTTLILVNSGVAPSAFTLQFTTSDGQPWALPIAGTDGTIEYSDVIPAGGVQFLQTAGVPGPTTQGWGTVITSGSIAGSVIFRQHLSPSYDSEGAVPLRLGSLRKFILPFDNTQGFSTAVAVANQDPSQATAISVVIRDPNGQVLGNETLNLNALTQKAFSLPAQFQETGNRRGVAEFSSPNVDLNAFGLRFNPLGSFTSVPPIQK